MPKQFLIGLSLLFASGVAASAECIKEASVTKWEVIASNKLVAYSGEKYLAFVTINSFALVMGKSVTLRFFSPSICRGDTVIVNGVSTLVTDVEPIRQQ